MKLLKRFFCLILTINFLISIFCVFSAAEDDIYLLIDYVIYENGSTTTDSYTGLFQKNTSVTLNIVLNFNDPTSETLIDKVIVHQTNQGLEKDLEPSRPPQISGKQVYYYYDISLVSPLYTSENGLFFNVTLYNTDNLTCTYNVTNNNPSTDIMGGDTKIDVSSSLPLYTYDYNLNDYSRKYPSLLQSQSPFPAGYNTMINYLENAVDTSIVKQNYNTILNYGSSHNWEKQYNYFFYGVVAARPNYPSYPDDLGDSDIPYESIFIISSNKPLYLLRVPFAYDVQFYTNTYFMLVSKENTDIIGGWFRRPWSPNDYYVISSFFSSSSGLNPNFTNKIGLYYYANYPLNYPYNYSWNTSGVAHNWLRWTAPRQNVSIFSCIPCYFKLMEGVLACYNDPFDADSFLGIAAVNKDYYGVNERISDMIQSNISSSLLDDTNTYGLTNDQIKAIARNDISAYIDLFSSQDIVPDPLIINIFGRDYTFLNPSTLDPVKPIINGLLTVLFLFTILWAIIKGVFHVFGEHDPQQLTFY